MCEDTNIILEEKRAIAHEKLQKAITAWYEYFGECEVGPERTQAAEVYDKLRLATRRY
jgi:hypothetical protein